MSEGQREQWWASFHELMAELMGRVRRRRTWRTWGPGAALVVAFAAFLVAGALRFDPAVNARPHVSLWVMFALIGVGGALVVAHVGFSWRVGSLGGPRHSPTSVISPEQQGRCLALIADADRDDHHQVLAASDLARRVAVQRAQGLGNAAFVLLMLSLILGDGQDLLSTAGALLVLLAHLAVLVARELRVQAARRFLQWQQAPLAVA